MNSKYLAQIGLTASLVAIAPAAIAQPYQAIAIDQARQETVEVSLYPGKVSTVSFLTGEKIIGLFEGDISRFVYSVHASESSQTIAFKPIQQLKIPGTLTSSKPNLQITTQDSRGQVHIYNLEINFLSNTQNQIAGIKLIPTPPKAPEPVVQPPQNQIAIGQGEFVSVDFVEWGLEEALSQKYIAAQDEAVAGIQNFIFFVRQGMPIDKSIAESNASPAVISELAKLGKESQLKLATQEITEEAVAIARRNIPESTTQLEEPNFTGELVRASNSKWKVLEKFIEDSIQTNRLRKNGREHENLKIALEQVKQGDTIRNALLDNQVSIIIFSEIMDLHLEN